MDRGTPGAAGNKVIRSERPIEIIEIGLAKVSEGFESQLDFGAIYH